MMSNEIDSKTAKTTLVDADQFVIQETSAGLTKKTLWSSIKATLKTYFDTLYVSYPVGSFYTQYPDADSSTELTAFPTAYRPAALFGNTWAAQWETENIFFRTLATDYQTRTNGLSADQVQGFRYLNGLSGDTTHLDQFSVYGRTTDGVPGLSAINFGPQSSSQTVTVQGKTSLPVADGTNGTPRTGLVTEPRNRLIKVWKRTA